MKSLVIDPWACGFIVRDQDFLKIRQPFVFPAFTEEPFQVPLKPHCSQIHPLIPQQATFQLEMPVAIMQSPQDRPKSTSHVSVVQGFVNKLTPTHPNRNKSGFNLILLLNWDCGGFEGSVRYILDQDKCLWWCFIWSLSQQFLCRNQLVNGYGGVIEIILLSTRVNEKRKEKFSYFYNSNFALICSYSVYLLIQVRKKLFLHYDSRLVVSLCFKNAVEKTLFCFLKTETFISSV